MSCVKMRRSVIAEIHPDHDPVEAAHLRHRLLLVPPSPFLLWRRDGEPCSTARETPAPPCASRASQRERAKARARNLGATRPPDCLRQLALPLPASPPALR